ncbi:hypothetical protein LINPERHAP2_LOCUS36844 [Linum perenne]
MLFLIRIVTLDIFFSMTLLVFRRSEAF